MDAIDAIKYLVANGCNASEWQQAGMWNAVCKLIASERPPITGWTKTRLDQLIVDAEVY